MTLSDLHAYFTYCERFYVQFSRCGSFAVADVRSFYMIAKFLITISAIIRQYAAVNAYYQFTTPRQAHHRALSICRSRYELVNNIVYGDFTTLCENLL